MKKEELARTLVLLGILFIVVYALPFQYERQVNSTDFQCYPEYHHSVTVRYDIDHSMGYYTNETIELIPPNWLLELYNVSVNENFKP